MASNKFSVVIIGAGQIGAFYDSPKSASILTHAHAFKTHSGFDIKGFVDVDLAKAKKAAGIWGGKAFSSIDAAYKTCKADVVCVAVPDEYHYQVLMQVAKYSPRFVLAEKPLAANVREGRRIIKIYEEKHIHALVNYTRRFVPEFEKLKTEIKKKVFGRYIKGSGYYGKGLFHNGSHLIDLLRFLIGEIKKTYFLGDEVDFSVDDKNVKAILHFENGGDFHLDLVNCNLYTLFELDLLFEKGRIKILNSGFKIEKYKIKKSKIYKNYTNLTLSKTIFPKINQACYFSADNIYKFLVRNEKIKSPLREGLKTLETCEKIARHE